MKIRERLHAFSKRVWTRIQWEFRIRQWKWRRNASRAVVRTYRVAAISMPPDPVAQNMYADHVLRHLRDFGETI